MLLQTLAETRAYQLSSEKRSGQSSAPELFARMAVKSLSGDQLYDCLIRAMGRASTTAQTPFVFAGQQNPGRAAFVAKFSNNQGDKTEYRSGIPAALAMMNGKLTADATDVESSELLAGIEAPFFSDNERIDVLFLATLSRPPREAERRKFVAYVKKHSADKKRREALSDVLWALLNSAEFALNH